MIPERLRTWALLPSGDHLNYNDGSRREGAVLRPLRQLHCEHDEPFTAAADVSTQTILADEPATTKEFDVRPPPAQLVSRAPQEVGTTSTSVTGVTLHRMPHILDPRGPLSFGEVGDQVPFEVRRYFLVFDVASEEIRGEHAHRALHQFLICVHGCCHLTADDGSHSEDFVLDHPSVGVHLPPMVWGVQHKYTPDAVLLVLASAPYDPADYIRDYAEFLELVKGVR